MCWDDERDSWQAIDGLVNGIVGALAVAGAGKMKERAADRRGLRTDRPPSATGATHENPVGTPAPLPGREEMVRGELNTAVPLAFVEKQVELAAIFGCAQIHLTERLE